MDDISSVLKPTPNLQTLTPKSIVGFDTGIKDNIYFLSDDFFEGKLRPYLNSILPDKDFNKSKIEIPSREILKLIKDFLNNNNIPTSFTYGGTTANIFYNISSILNYFRSNIDIKFVATGKESLDDLKKKNVKILLSKKSSNYAESVLIYLGNSRSKRTLIYRGDFQKVISENIEDVRSQVFQDNTLYMLMGSVLGKIGQESFSNIVSCIKQLGNSVYTLNLPTDKDTSVKYNEYLFELISGAAITFSNLEELCFLSGLNFREKDCFDLGQNPNDNAKSVLNSLQRNLSEGAHGLITAGEFGAFLVFKTDYLFIPAVEFEGTPYSNGAGDTTIGVYISSLLLGDSPEISLWIAMECASSKLKVNSSRLFDIGKHYAKIGGK